VAGELEADLSLDVSASSFPSADGELGGLIRDFDWAGTELGPISHWPAALRTATNIVLASPLPLVMLWGPNGRMIYNDAYSVFAAQRHPGLLGSKVLDGWPEVADFNRQVLDVCLAGGTLSFRNHELTLYRNNAPEQVSMNLNYGPVLGDDGRPAGVLAIVIETTAHVLAERRLRESEARFRALVTATSDVVYRMSADWQEMRQLEGRGFLADTAGPKARWMDDYLYPEDQPAIRAAIELAIRERTPFQLEHRVRTAQGSGGWTLSRAIPLMNEGGEINEWFGAATDVTARRQAEEHLRLVNNELNHRVKNTLATVQALAAQTFKSADRAARDEFEMRLASLAAAHDLLTERGWGRVGLSELVTRSLRVFQEADRWSAEGADADLSPKAIIALAMTLHELGMNATKYGAWSQASGRVEMSWRVGESGDERPLKMVWQERDGPPVVAPTGRGFGSRLIERGLSGELGGTSRLTFARTGVVCEIEIPIQSIRQVAAPLELAAS
jgi:two-component sensor histidine kinase